MNCDRIQTYHSHFTDCLNEYFYFSSQPRCPWPVRVMQVRQQVSTSSPLQAVPNSTTGAVGRSPLLLIPRSHNHLPSSRPPTPSHSMQPALLHPSEVCLHSLSSLNSLTVWLQVCRLRRLRMQATISTMNGRTKTRSRMWAHLLLCIFWGAMYVTWLLYFWRFLTNKQSCDLESLLRKHHFWNRGELGRYATDPRGEIETRRQKQRLWVEIRREKTWIGDRRNIKQHEVTCLLEDKFGWVGSCLDVWGLS